LSSSDNRPSSKGNQDGESMSAEGTDSNHTFFAQTNLPDGYLVLHKVDGYEVGSQAEQDTMDLLEKEETDHFVQKRMRMFRIGDPRRYSMWFARAWAWRFTQQLAIDFDFFTFGRPDSLWMIPVPTVSFFEDFRTTDHDIWTHDSYYSGTADTFAFIRSYDAAHRYFSIPYLVQEGVACLGGPTFNQSVANVRLLHANISTVESDWCDQQSNAGWSEMILSRKLQRSGLVIRYLPAASMLVRGPSNPDCAPLAPTFLIAWATHHPSNVGFMACLAAEKMFKDGKSASEVLDSRPFVLRGNNREWGKHATTCLTLSTLNQTLIQMPCQNPIPPEQLFLKIVQSNKSSATFGCNGAELIPVRNMTADLESFWITEPAELYSSKTLDPAQ
jgi:hypothetical protein